MRQKGQKMEPNKMTIEGFFLADYERLREENEKLKAMLPSNGSYGVKDLGHPTDAVKVGVASVSTLCNGKYNGITLGSLKEAMGMSDEELWEWATKEYKHNERWYSPLHPIEVSYHKYQYTLRVTETRSDEVFVTDGEEGSQLLVLGHDNEDCLEVWMDMESFERIKKAALNELFANIEEAVIRLEESTE